MPDRLVGGFRLHDDGQQPAAVGFPNQQLAVPNSRMRIARSDRSVAGELLNLAHTDAATRELRERNFVEQDRIE